MDAFLSRFEITGRRLWATYFGGNGDDHGLGLAVASDGDIVVFGYTSSVSGVATANGYQTTFGGGREDAFVARFDEMGRRIFATYYGYSGDEVLHSAAVLTDGSVVVAGATNSISGIASSGSHQVAYGGGISDALLVRFTQSGQRSWATYYGGSNTDCFYKLALLPGDGIVAAGYTDSPNAIATAGSHQTEFGGRYDSFITCFTSIGGRLWGTYY